MSVRRRCYRLLPSYKTCDEPRSAGMSCARCRGRVRFDGARPQRAGSARTIRCAAAKPNSSRTAT
jgi:hypothetical protein